MLLKALCVLFVLSASAVGFDCPKNHITINDGITGKLPAGASSMVQIPAGTDCTYTFDLPKGYALKMETSAVYDISPGDFVMFEYFYILSGEDKRVEYGIQSQLPFQVYSKTGNLTFFATYTYLDVSHYKQKTLPTGTYFNTTLEPNLYYTMQASQGDKATFKLSMLETGFYDHSIYEVFVFDGENFIEGEYIGRLSELLRLINFRSDSRSFTFLNLYRTPSTSYVFGNDWSKVKNLAQYNTWVIDPTKETKGYMYNIENDDDAYYTFFCDGCTSFYIESLQFDTSISNDPSGYVEVSELSPTQGLAPIHKYTFSQFTNASLPQLISSSVATFHTHKSAVVFKLRVKLQSDWLSAASNKKDRK
uniref:CUB_2 domain-containing protein n=1 Tax=Caenorhabditis japonica TaxID=281687 RepID=A0A8R1I0X6_CAEJA